MLFTFPSIVSLIILSVLALLIGIQVYLHFRYYWRIIKHKNPNIDAEQWPSVSIIICARSEYENLQELVPQLLQMDYPNFEIILIDDASWDGSTDYIEQLQKTESKIKGVFVTEDIKKNHLGKKLALSLGIKAAKNEVLLLTDADCRPQSQSWIKAMVYPYTQNPKIEVVLGYSPFFKQSKLVNLVARMENIYTGLNYLGFALRQNPYMGVGRNLSYKRDLFFAHKGFASHLHIASGDDDLFINQVSTAQNTAVCLNPEGFVYSYSKNSFSEWFKQKKRHIAAGKYYKIQHKRALAFYAFTHHFLWISFALSMYFADARPYGLIALGIYWLFKWPIMTTAFKRLKQGGSAFWIPFFDILYWPYCIFIALISYSKKQRSW